MRGLVVAALMLLGLGACVTKDVQLDRGNIERGSRVATRGEQCTLAVFDLVDVRRYAGLGWVGQHELLYPELAAWLREHLQRAASTDTQRPRLQIELNRAYLEPHPSGHSFQLVLRARGASEPNSEWRVYRGNIASVTWWASDAEFGSYVREAGFAAIKALVSTEGECSGRSRH